MIDYDARRAASAYTTVGLETTVEAASPHKLTLMLFDGAIKSTRSAKTHMRDRRIAAKGESISRGIAILEELTASLNHEVGGELTANLDALYGYMTRRLVEANLHNQEDILDEVARLLGELREAWAAIESTPSAPMPTMPSVPSDEPCARFRQLWKGLA